MKQTKINQLNEVGKVLATSDVKVRYIDELRKKTAELQNLLRSNQSKIADYHADTGEWITPELLEQINSQALKKEHEVYELMLGMIEYFRTNEYKKGIKGHGIQLNMFSERFLTVGNDPASTHKGGIASAR